MDLNKLSRNLVVGLDTLADKVDQWTGVVENKFSEAKDSMMKEGIGDIYELNRRRYKIIRRLAEGF